MSASNSAFGNALLRVLVAGLSDAVEAHIAHTGQPATANARKKRVPQQPVLPPKAANDQ